MNINAVKDKLFYAWKYRNWKSILSDIQSGREPLELVLRNGIQIRSHELNPIRGIVYEVFFSRTLRYANDMVPLEKNDLVVDIGANVGVFTLYVASITRNRVFSFEPFPENYRFLQTNIQANGFENVVPQAAAVTDEKGTKELFVSKQGGWHSTAAKSDQSLSVATTTLSDIFTDNKIEVIDFLKIDCEGEEGAILLSTPKDLFPRIRKISMEFHDRYSQLSHSEIIAFLNNLGYKTRMAWDGKAHVGHIWAKR